jgi:hypothetical protein
MIKSKVLYFAVEIMHAFIVSVIIGFARGVKQRQLDLVCPEMCTNVWFETSNLDQRRTGRPDRSRGYVKLVCVDHSYWPSLVMTPMC